MGRKQEEDLTNSETLKNLEDRRQYAKRLDFLGRDSET